MANNEQVEKLDFNALVVQCAGPDRKEQESFLAVVVMKSLIERLGRDSYLPDKNVLRVLGVREEDVSAAIRVLDGVYAWVSKSLLGDPCCDLLYIRSYAIKYMRAELERRQKIQREAGI